MVKVGNFDSDNSEEIFGINANYAVAFNFNTSLNTVTWDGTYNSVIADWSIPKGSATYDNYVFLNTDKNSKQQDLLTLRNNGQYFSANLYAFRENNISSNPCPSARLASNSTSDLKENILNDQNDLKLYPNPSTGVVNVTLKEGEASGLVRVIDVAGKELYVKQITSTDSALDLSAFENGIYFVILESSTQKSTSKVIINK